MAGACASFGTGTNGPLTVNTPTVLTTPDSPVTGTAGASTATVTTPAGFAAGQAVLLQQTQGTGAGAWETNVITSVGVRRGPEPPEPARQQLPLQRRRTTTTPRPS